MDPHYLNRPIISLESTRYEIIGDLIGEGGYGKVFKVQDTESNRIYAGKFVNISDIVQGEQKALKIITKDEYILGKVLHQVCGDTYIQMMDLFPNVEIDDPIRGLYGIYYLIVMEYLEGMDLATWIETEIDTDEEYFQSTESVQYRIALGYCLAITIGNALNCMHSNGFMHNDIKPDNIFLSFKEGSDTPIFKFLDFGLACEAIENTSEKTSCKNAGKICVRKSASGTPVTIAPEVFECERNFIKSESWSVGITLYALVFGEYPDAKTNYTRYIQNMARIKSTFFPMWFLLINLIEANTRKRWSMDQLVTYVSENPEIQESIRRFNLSCG